MTRLNPSLEISLKVKLNLLLKQNVELLTLPAQELEDILKEESLSNPFIKDFVVKAPDIFYCKEPCQFEIPYTPSELEEIEKNIRLEFSGEELHIAKELLKHIDERGFLRKEPESVAEELNIPVEKVEKVRRKILSLDPVGVMSLNVEEFLRVQIEEIYPEEKDFLLEELEKLLRGKKISEEVKRRLAALRLSPLSPTNPVYKVAKLDAVIEEEEGELIPYLYEDYLEIDLSEEYIELYKKAKGKTKEFLKEAYERYKDLAKVLNLRRENLRKILKIVVEVQRDFLLGRGNLKSLSLVEVAGELGVHISTVSRLVSSKYVKTPVGTYLLKFFFARESVDGISQDELMGMIKEIVETENKEKPLSDEEIAKILQERGYRVARRTVAKYRKLLGIPSSRDRRCVN